jgi:hypothetical protein
LGPPGGEPLWIVLSRPSSISPGAHVAANVVKQAAPANGSNAWLSLGVREMN